MASLRDTLHDEIDQYEDLAAEAAEAVESAKSQLSDILKKTDDFTEILTELSALAAKELADTTTKAARAGMAMSRKRAKVANA